VIRHRIKTCPCMRCASRRVKASRRLRLSLDTAGMTLRVLDCAGVHSFDQLCVLWRAKFR
jgi:hypothetical protein